MNIREEQTWIDKVKEWQKTDGNSLPVTEVEAIHTLQYIEEKREQLLHILKQDSDDEKEQKQMVGADQIELDQAEATVLTILAQIRWRKTQQISLVEEWLKKARKLDPDNQQAASLQAEIYLHSLLQSLKETAQFPTIRETDNAATRKKVTAQFVIQIQERLDDLVNWEDMLQAGTQAAQLSMNTLLQQKYKSLREGTLELEEALILLHKEAQKYADSVQGLFYSSELLARLQQANKKLQEIEQSIREQLTPTQAEVDLQDHIPAMEQIDQLVGLTDMKKRVKQLAQFLQYQRIRTEKGWELADPLELHAVLMGNPGTGKTTLARLLATLYHELGLLERAEVIEVDRSQLVGAYVGQSEQRTMEVIKKAVGGVLFIDEAYSLKRAESSDSDYGQVVIDTLVSAMTSGEYSGKFVLILAGYPEEMRNFLRANPGLRSRFPESNHFTLPDFTTDELLQVAEQVAERNDFILRPDTKISIQQRLEKERVDETFGNARTAKNIILDAIFAKGSHVVDTEAIKIPDFTILTPVDVEANSSCKEVKINNLSAKQRLDQMIGLVEMKAELTKVAAFVSIQRSRQENGLPAVPVELHAVFTGNPGTGKTTVAQLYAQILQEVGYLKRGHLVTVGRADLVANYVGQTASKTKRKIKEALGGVLFIDEAYALMSSSENDYGQEAVNTLVEEISKHGENLVVVLAGYPYDMQKFIDSNPGLSSRFKKYFRFPDYTASELLSIITQFIQDNSYEVMDETQERLAEQLGTWSEQGRIKGNGRFAKNMVQEAMQEQALRLAAEEKSDWTKEDLSLLTWGDFSKATERMLSTK
ncbi:AAA family ATPase [Brevibacillus laterosporus]|uniref:AAA family ATPase n=1 Tax=Brevibacillus laterosporus TaxID=1465 RepID=UPI0018F8A22E|nr:AAA family ATPase [Brevibacillus laterosporus]MBG9774699.1 ATPase AAA [Brevibacillus laterosporus]MCR8935841.1 AAA family ATPase [Brevibacillus laterosporus]MCZ0838480.1 AAA family ATPase [Brevibacillus laterosporus]MCZ0844448.1 AAA family ATPase [Brevibacillus laterosporus]